MRAIKRGFRSFHRHWVRNLVVVLLLFVCLTFSLSMLAVKLAADNQVQEVKASVGNYGEMKVSSDYQLQVFNQERSKTQAERSAEARSMTPEQQLEQRAQFLVPEAQTDAASQKPAIITYDKVLDTRITVSGITNTELESAFSLRQRSGNEAGPAALSSNSFEFEGNTNGPSASDFIIGNKVLSEGAFFTYQDYQKANPVVLIEKNLAESNNLHVGDSITALISGETGAAAEVPLKIIGIYETIQTQQTQQQNQNQTFNPAGNEFFAPLPIVQKLNATPGYVTLGSYYFDNESNANAAQQAFDPDPVSISSTSTNRFEFVTDQADYQAISDPLTKVSKTSVIGLAGALGACALIILLAMAIIIGGRTRELGVLKAIGATNRQVMAQYAVEVICICLVAIILAMGTTAIISQSMGNWLLGNKTVTVNESQTTQAGQQGPQNFRGGGIPGRGNGSLYIQGSSPTANNQKSVQLNVVYQGSLFLYSILILVFIGLLGMAVPVIWITRLKPARVLSIE